MEPKIDLFIVGAQKSATTSLLNYLGEHPQILAHSQQEMSYFVSDEEYALGYAAAFDRYFGHNARTKKGAQRVVAKHASQCHRDGAIQRLRDHNPDCKLAMIVRNPVDRAYSSYLMEKKKRGTEGAFDHVIRSLVDETKDWRRRAYLEYGLYHQDIEKLLAHFGRDALTVFAFEELKANPAGVSQSVFRLLGVDDTYVPEQKVHNEGGSARSPQFARLINEHVLNPKAHLNKLARRIVAPHHAARIGAALRRVNRDTRKAEPMRPETRAFLVEYYKPHNDALGKLLGRDFSHWNQ